MRYLYIVNPPARKGYTNERSLSGGIGVARKLKLWEKPQLLLPAPDLLLAAAVGEQHGLKTAILDLILEEKYGEEAVDYTVEQIRREAGPEDEIWVGVRLSIPTLPPDLHFANRLKERLPHLRLFLLGNVIMTTLDHWSKETNADFVVYGEPEAVLGPVFQAQGEAWRDQPGVIDPKTYVPAQGEALYDGSQQKFFNTWVKVNEMAEIPYPAYHLLPMHRYAPGGDLSKLFVYVTASRGCPIGCTMCPYMLHEGRPLRVSTADRVVDELEWLNKTYGIYMIRFRDPNFGFNRKLVREILTKVIERGVKMAATVEVSLEVVDDNLIELMAKAGVTTITTGIESNDADCLESIGQKVSINPKLAEKIALADRLGIHVYGTFVIGAPEETWETVEKTIQFSKTVPCECAFTVMTPFPGTPLYFRALREGLLNKEMKYEQWNSFEATVRTYQMTTDDLALARLWARLELVIPYRLQRAKKAGIWAYLRTQAKMIPRRLALAYVRAAVAYRRKKGSPPVSAPSNRPRGPRGTMTKIPLNAK